MKKRAKDNTCTPIEKARSVKRKNYGHETESPFFKNILSRRLELNLTQEQLAEIIGFDRTWVTRLEKGTFPQSPDKIVAIADALDVSLDVLFGREEER